MLGGIEAGGTKFVCAVSDHDLNIHEKISLPTTTPEETYQRCFEFFDRFDIEALGIGSFGPVDINEASETYGYITSTPKPHWGNTDFVGVFKERYQVPIGFTTDVNAAALGEYELGAARGKNSCVYVTVGTGIGGGAVVNGQPLEGFSHPEMGHLLVKIHPDDHYEGFCPYHGNCLEGIAAGPALAGRAGQKAQNLPADHPHWEFQAYYLAQAAMTYTLMLSPECIIFGGGVMNQAHLFPMIYEEFSALLNDYVKTPPLEEYIIPTGLDGESGILGSLILGKRALDDK